MRTYTVDKYLYNSEEEIKYYYHRWLLLVKDIVGITDDVLYTILYIINLLSIFYRHDIYS